MNIKDYIQSGIIESYVLGLCTEAEKQEFEDITSLFPQIAKAKNAFELSLEEQSKEEAVEPPEVVKHQIFEALHSAGNTHSPKRGKAYTAIMRKLNVWKSIAAAFILLLGVTCYYAYSIKDNYKKLDKENIELQDQLAAASNNNPISILNSIVKKTSTKWAAMREPQNTSHCMAHVYWDTISKNIYLLVGNIPAAISNKQFQLWALQDSEAVNLGVFDATKQGKVLHMKNVHTATAFIITLEPNGGSTVPNMQTIYASAKL